MPRPFLSPASAVAFIAGLLLALGVAAGARQLVSDPHPHVEPIVVETPIPASTTTAVDATVSTMPVVTESSAVPAATSALPTVPAVGAVPAVDPGPVIDGDDDDGDDDDDDGDDDD